MNVDGIVKFLVALGVDHDDITVRRERGWVNARCPLAPYTHGAGEDRHPSFGVTIKDDGPSRFNCFGCTTDAARLDWLLHHLWVLSGSYPTEAARVFRLEEIHVPERKKDDIPDYWSGRVRKDVSPLHPEVLRRYPLLQGAVGYEADRCREWLAAERGIPIWVQNMCRLRYSPDDQWVVFPLTSFDGGVYLLRARSRKKKWIRTVSPEMAGMPGATFPKLRSDVGAWFGMMLIDWDKPVWLVEGELDAMRLMALGCLNVMASASAQVTDLQLDALKGNSVVMGYDDDLAGRNAHARIVNRLEEQCHIREVTWGHAINAKGKPCSDAGDLPDRKQLLKVVAGARRRDLIS